MVIKFPVFVSLVGAIIHFAYTVKLRRFKVSEKPPASRAHLSVEQRQQKIVIGSWISFAIGCVFLVAAIVFTWLENSNLRH
jgi:hypothetical protein